MGLEIVELVMGVEERFDIEIPDEDAEKLETVGAIHAYVWVKVKGRQTVPCPSQAAFHKLRRGLMETLAVHRGDVRPGTALDSLLPVSERRARCKGLGRALDRRLPELEMPPPVTRVIFNGTCFLLAASCVGFLTGHPSWGTAGLAGSAAFAWLAFKATAPLAVQLPVSCATVGAAVRTIVGPEPNGRQWTEPEVWEALKAVVLEHLDAKPEDVTPNAHLVHDLGAG